MGSRYILNPDCHAPVTAHADRMKSSAGWVEFWKAVLVEMGDVPPPQFATLRTRPHVERGLADLEAKGRGDTEVACGYFAKFCEWPETTPTVRWLALLRVAHALEVSFAVTIPYQNKPVFVVAPQMDEEAMREWFLIDSWSSGRLGWLSRLADADLSGGQTSPTPGPN